MTKRRAELPLRHLTIFLLKESVTDDDRALKQPNNLVSYDVDVGLQRRARLYIETQQAHRPSWAEVFAGQVPEGAFGRVASSAAVLLVHLDRRFFAVCFGHGRHLLDANSWEERFGLVVVLNSIGQASLRTVDKHTLGSEGIHSRVQTSRDAPVRDFGIDIEQDLVRAVTGTPTDINSIGHKVTGADALAVGIPIDLRQLGAQLRVYLQKSSETSYRTRFPWIDQIAEVRRPDLRDELDSTLVQRINARDFSRLWMAVPEIVDWTRIQGFRFGRPRLGAMVSDVTFAHFLKEYPDEEFTIDFLRTRYVRMIDLNDVEIEHWPIYRCIYCEIENPGETFMLNGGKWYQVKADFVEDVNLAFARFPRYGGQLPAFSDASEEAYNERVANANRQRFALMDRKPVQVSGMSSPVEFCDLFTSDRDMVHVKRYGASSVLSHLFAQGTVSGELFLANEAFRRRVRALLPRGHKDLIDPRGRPAQDAFQVIFAVVSQQSGTDISLPFFSRVHARNARQRLENFGYRVSLAKISMEESVAKKRVIPEGRKGGR